MSKQHIKNLECHIGANGGEVKIIDCSVLTGRTWKKVQGWLGCTNDGDISLIAVGEMGDIERYDDKTRIGFVQPVH